MITKLIRNACSALLPALFAAIAAAQTPDGAIREVLEKQSSAWNNGDVATFVSYYTADCTFVGETATRGPAELLERYKKRYPTRERMGRLTFSGIEVRVLGKDHALVTGKYHLDRTQAGGGNADGTYTLIFRKTAAGWRVLHDHTS